MKTRRNRQRGSGIFSGLFGKKNTTEKQPLTQLQQVQKIHDVMVNPISGHSQGATEARQHINAAQTVGQTLGLGTSAFAGIAAGMALAGKGALLGAAAGFPPLLAALMGTYLACLFVARQRNINRELMANLYIIKVEIERMKRVYAVIEQIAKERGIDLNTVALRGIVNGLGKKIMLFAGKDTKAAITNIESFLKEGNTEAAAKLVDDAEKVLNDTMARNTTKGGFRSFIQDGTFASWKARWLSPTETLRIIIRDVTIANIWFSIMIAEYNVFKEYMEIIQPPKSFEWTKSKEMVELMVANKQLRSMTEGSLHNYQKNNSKYSTFYSILNDPETFKIAVASATTALNKQDETAAILKEEGSSGSETPRTPEPTNPETPTLPGQQLTIQIPRQSN